MFWNFLPMTRYLLSFIRAPTESPSKLLHTVSTLGIAHWTVSTDWSYWCPFNKFHQHFITLMFRRNDWEVWDVHRSQVSGLFPGTDIGNLTVWCSGRLVILDMIRNNYLPGDYKKLKKLMSDIKCESDI